jgi:hypothetical protein
MDLRYTRHHLFKHQVDVHRNRMVYRFYGRTKRGVHRKIRMHFYE